MALKDKLMSEGMKLAANPAVAKLMQDERFMKLVMAAMSMPGRVNTFTAEQKEHFAKAMGLATQEEVRDLKRTVAALERAPRPAGERLAAGDGPAFTRASRPVPRLQRRHSGVEWSVPTGAPRLA